MTTNWNILVIFCGNASFPKSHRGSVFMVIVIILIFMTNPEIIHYSKGNYEEMLVHCLNLQFLSIKEGFPFLSSSFSLFFISLPSLPPSFLFPFLFLLYNLFKTPPSLSLSTFSFSLDNYIYKSLHIWFLIKEFYFVPIWPKSCTHLV